MTLQSSGPIKFSELQTEFGGSNPISLSEYYAGGARVPAGTTGANGAVPSSGIILMSKFYGTTAMAVTASNVGGSASGFASGGNVNSTGSAPNPVVTGGTAPFTYAWTHVSTSSGDTPSISNASSANPVWSAFVEDVNPSVSTWNLTVTSSGGGSSASVQIIVDLTWTNLQ